MTREDPGACLHALLTSAAMAHADRWTIESGHASGIELMENAGAAIARAALQRFPAARRFHVLCGPGNNGGDGYVAGRILADTGCEVALYRMKEPKQGTDAAEAARRWNIGAGSLEDFRPKEGDVVLDALFGAGLARELESGVAETLARATEAACSVLAVDLPSGVNGDSGRNLGGAIPTELTVTFFRKKPGHLLYPGRDLCGELVVADIGVRGEVFEEIPPTAFENAPGLWMRTFPSSEAAQHKYSRGHVAVFSGPRHATGAARLSAMAAQRAGAGAVTILGETNALDIHAAHVTSIMLRKRKKGSRLDVLEKLNSVRACVLGPGFGDAKDAREIATAVLGWVERDAGLVLDADGITAFQECPERLFDAARATAKPRLVLTPHAGEFARLFPDIAGDAALSKLDKAQAAAKRANAIVLYKGPDTVVAEPDGLAVINATGTPTLATAGSGDVLGGIIAGLMAQGMPAFEAACAGAWTHGVAAQALGFGAIAEDIVVALRGVMQDLVDS